MHDDAHHLQLHHVDRTSGVFSLLSCTAVRCSWLQVTCERCSRKPSLTFVYSDTSIPVVQRLGTAIHHTMEALQAKVRMQLMDSDRLVAMYPALTAGPDCVFEDKPLRVCSRLQMKSAKEMEELFLLACARGLLDDVRRHSASTQHMPVIRMNGPPARLCAATVAPGASGQHTNITIRTAVLCNFFMDNVAERGGGFNETSPADPV